MDYEHWIETTDGRTGPRYRYGEARTRTALAFIGIQSFAITELLDVATGPAVGIRLQNGDRLWIASVEENYDEAE